MVPTTRGGGELNKNIEDILADARKDCAGVLGAEKRW